MAAPEPDDLLKARVDSEFRVVLGEYMKADKGVSFELLEDGEGLKFRFKGKATAIEEFTCTGFTVTSDNWCYGHSTFTRDVSDLFLIVLKETTEGKDVFCYNLVPDQVEQLHVFKDVGALVVHRAVPPELLDAALSTIKEIVRDAERTTKEVQEVKPESIPFHDANSKEKAVLALANPLWPLVRAIVGDEELALPTAAQVVVRCTASQAAASKREADAASRISPEVHIDGLSSGENKNSPNTVKPFTLLLGIPLQDCDDSTQRGNFSFVPRSHKAMASGASTKFSSAEAAANCLKVPGQSRTPYEAIQKFVELKQLESPVQVKCQAGGAFLAHNLTLHYGQPNIHVKASVTVYFRVKLAENRSQWPQCLLKEHMFAEMSGLPSDSVIGVS